MKFVKFNKFMKGQIDMEGKTVNLQSAKQKTASKVAKLALSEEKTEKLKSFL